MDDEELLNEKLKDYSSYNLVTLHLILFKLTNTSLDKNSRKKYVSHVKKLKDHLEKNPNHSIFKGKDLPQTILSLLDNIISDHDK